MMSHLIVSQEGKKNPYALTTEHYCCKVRRYTTRVVNVTLNPWMKTENTARESCNVVRRTELNDTNQIFIAGACFNEMLKIRRWDSENSTRWSWGRRGEGLR
jgi:hypothetical protein